MKGLSHVSRLVWFTNYATVIVLVPLCSIYDVKIFSLVLLQILLEKLDLILRKIL